MVSALFTNRRHWLGSGCLAPARVYPLHWYVRINLLYNGFNHLAAVVRLGHDTVSVEPPERLNGTPRPTFRRQLTTQIGEHITVVIDASASNEIFGFDPAGHGLVGGVAPFRRTAPNPWRLGPILNASFTIDPTGAPASFTVGGSRYWQDLPTAIRALGSTDADDRNATGNLQALDVAINGTSAKWLIDETGHVVTSWRTGTMASVTWLDTDFRDRLGFSGLESVQSSGFVDYLRADYPLPGSVLLVDGFELHTIGSVTARQVRDLSGGGVASIATDTHTANTTQCAALSCVMSSGDDSHM